MRPVRWLLAGLVVVSVALHGCSPDEAQQASDAGK